MLSELHPKRELEGYNQYHTTAKESTNFRLVRLGQSEIYVCRTLRKSLRM